MSRSFYVMGEHAACNGAGCDKCGNTGREPELIPAPKLRLVKPGGDGKRGHIESVGRDTWRRIAIEYDRDDCDSGFADDAAEKLVELWNAWIDGDDVRRAGELTG